MISFGNVFGVGTGKGVTEITVANRGVDVAAGDILVVSIGLNSATSIASVTDSVGNTYSFAIGATNLNGVRTEIWTAKAIQDMPSGVGVIYITTSANAAICAVVTYYSGAVALGTTGSGYSGSPSTTPNGSLATQDANNWVVFSFCFRGSASVNYPGGIGNLRVTEPTFGNGANSNCHVGASDNTSPFPSSVENEALLSASSSWVGVSLELRTV